MKLRNAALSTVLYIAFAIICLPDASPGQEATEKKASANGAADLIAAFDPAIHVVAGEWQKSGAELQVAASRFARAVLPAQLTGNYSLTLEFTRTESEDSVGVILPVGERQCVFNLSVFGGEAHGIAVVDGGIARDNATTLRPGKLDNDHPYRLLIEVELDDGKASIGSQLDGRPFLQWSGKPQSLTMLDFWRLPQGSSLGLVANSGVTFHKISLRPLDPKMRMTRRPPAVSAQLIEFEGRKWASQNASGVEVERFNGRDALHVVGQEQAFVYLPEASFKDGTIEVDIASSTFSGIGFRGSKDGKVVEKLYFRPFNSNTAKHQNTVQYSLLGRPGFGWRDLREKFPGRYEAGADLQVDGWFHVRVDVNARRLEAFVNEGEEPVLVVDELLGDVDEGVIGVWGWDSYFSNFKFTPLEP